LLFGLEITRSALRRIDLYPVFIEDCRTVPAAGEAREAIVRRIAALCAEMGTAVRRDVERHQQAAGERVWIEAP
jgi:hypothetical protein